MLDLRRREFITLLGVAWPLGARAQQADRARRIGVLRAFAWPEVSRLTHLRANDKHPNSHFGHRLRFV
jgi:hypothetical protein